MNETYSMIGGGRLGDFLHQLYVPKILYNETRKKTKLYIDNIGDSFRNSLNETFTELEPIIKKQDFIESFNIYEKNYFDEKIDINLSSWRSSPFLYRRGWTDLLHLSFNIPIKPLFNECILKWDNQIKNKIGLIINRSMDTRRHCENESIMLKVIETFPEDQRFFVCSPDNIQQYNVFPFKKYVKLLIANSLKDFFDIINSCEFYMGNLTGITSIAYVLGKNMLCEFGSVDSLSYLEEVKFHNNISYYNLNKKYFNSYMKEKIDE